MANACCVVHALCKHPQLVVGLCSFVGLVSPQYCWLLATVLLGSIFVVGRTVWLVGASCIVGRAVLLVGPSCIVVVGLCSILGARELYSCCRASSIVVGWGCIVVVSSIAGAV